MANHRSTLEPESSPSPADRARSDLRWGQLPWMDAPTNTGEYEEMIRSFVALCDELMMKAPYIAASNRARLTSPKPGSKLSLLVQSLRFDLRWAAWRANRPYAGVAAGAELMSKSMREAWRRYLEIVEIAQQRAREAERTRNDGWTD